MAAAAIGAGMSIAGMLGSALFGGSQAGQIAQNAAQQAQQSSGIYGARAAQTYGKLYPQLSQMATNPYGLAPATYAQIQSGQLQSAAGQAGSAEERARLAAQRSGNAASAGALGAAGAEAAARGAGSNLLKLGELQAHTQAQQQAEGLRGLQGLYGTSERGQAQMGSEVAPDVKAAVAAGNGSWLQNLSTMGSAMANGTKSALGMANLLGQASTGGASGGAGSWMINGANTADNFTPFPSS